MWPRFGSMADNWPPRKHIGDAEQTRLAGANCFQDNILRMTDNTQPSTPEGPQPEQNRPQLGDVLPLIYKELRALAAGYMRQERPNHTLQPTALINEAFLRISDRDDVDWSDRRSFFAAAAQAMRRLLVDHARSKGRDKRGGGHERVPLQDILALTGVDWEQQLDLIGLDEALDKLAAINADHVRIVELRFFAGLSVEETASAMGISVSSVERGWRTAKAWLFRALSECQGPQNT